MKVRIAKIIEESFVDGDGIRFTIFLQGCHHNCAGCHNPATHSFTEGEILDTAEIIERFKHKALIKGITLSGGEPLCQIEASTEFATVAKNANLNVWCYTGFTYEYLTDEHFKSNEYFTKEQIQKFLSYVDVLVDGPFILEQRDLTMQFCGSHNQRLIDIKKTFEQKKIITWNSK